MYNLVLFIVTLFILSGDTLKYLGIDKGDDWSIQAFSCFSLAIYCFDILMRYLCEDQYLGSFLFWMDVISLSAVIWDIILNSYSNAVWHLNKSQTFMSVGESLRVFCLLRIARMARVVTLIDNFRAWVPETFSKVKRRANSVLPVNTPEGAEPSPQKTEQIKKERSRVSNEFIEMTVRKVIVVIVVVCVFFPLLEPSRIIYSNPLPKNQRDGLAQINSMSELIYSQSPVSAEQMQVLKAYTQVSHLMGSS